MFIKKFIGALFCQTVLIFIKILIT